MDRNRTPRPARWIAGLVAVSTFASLTGCATFKAYFPSRDEIYKPIPTSLGEARVTGTDTSWVVRGPGYLLVSRDRESLPETKAALDRAVATWRRWFGAPPPDVGVSLVGMRKYGRGEARDTTRGRMDDSSGAVLIMMPPRDAPMAGPVRVTPVLGAWLAAHVTDVAGPPHDTAATDSTAGRRRRPRWMLAPHDPRVPDWVAVAVPTLLEESPRADFLVTRLAYDTTQVRASDVFGMRRPDETGRGERGIGDGRARTPDERERERQGMGMEEPAARRRGGRGTVLSPAMRFDATAVALARFLQEKQGAAFVGTLVDATLQGTSPAQVLQQAPNGAMSMSELDSAFQAWLARQVADRER